MVRNFTQDISELLRYGKGPKHNGVQYSYTNDSPKVTVSSARIGSGNGCIHHSS